MTTPQPPQYPEHPQHPEYPQHPQQPQYHQPYPHPMAPPQGTNGMAIAAFCVSFLGICGAILSTIFSLVALGQIRKSGQKGKGFAVAGLCISALWVVGIAVAVALAILTDPRDSDGTITEEASVSVLSLRVGDCLKNVVSDDEVSSMTAIPCAQPHAGEVFGTFELERGPFPGQDSMIEEATRRCEDLFDDYASGATADLVEEFTFISPTESGWRLGDRGVTCIAVTPKDHVGSIKS